MNRTVVTLILSLLVSGFAMAQENISLNGEWDFSVPGKMAPVKVTVPHTYNVMDGLEDYAGKAFYSRLLPVTGAMKGKQVRICFNAVYHDARVYVNGILAGTDMKISLRVKDSIPSYILRGYYVSYVNASGEPVVIDLPDLSPGAEHTLVASAINESYSFEVCRKDGSRVLSY